MEPGNSLVIQIEMNLNENFITLKQGAEGKIYKGQYLGKSVIVKERFKKLYRLSELDEQLAKERMKAEAKAIVRSKAAGVLTPAIYLVDFDQRIIVMEEIESSITVKDYINNIVNSEQEEEIKQKQLEHVSINIGSTIGKIHLNNIVHGDLTTSNMLVTKDTDNYMSHLFLIDFGLSSLDPNPEDKGVDLYVLERALLSTHKDSEELFSHILEGYKQVYKKKSFSEVLNKLEEVRARGRKRTMVG